MKKALIAGAASVALAVMPVLGVFADGDITTMTDTLNITVQDTCTFRVASGTVDQSFTATMSASEVKTWGASSATVYCNKYNGYTVTAAFEGLAGKVTGTETSNGNTIAYKSGSVAVANDGKWSAALSGTGITGTVYPASGATIITQNANTPAAGNSFEAVYTVGAAADQAAGTYSGTATYTLTAAE